MGGVSPDRAVSPPSPLTAVTLGGMALRNWEMTATCNRCGVVLHVDVPALVRMHGADMLWWGRRPRCRVLGCRGRVTFSARAIRNGSWVQMGRRLSAREVEMGMTMERRVPPAVTGSVDWRRGPDGA